LLADWSYDPAFGGQDSTTQALRELSLFAGRVRRLGTISFLVFRDLHRSAGDTPRTISSGPIAFLEMQLPEKILNIYFGIGPILSDGSTLPALLDWKPPPPR